MQIRIGTYEVWDVNEDQFNQLLWLKDHGIAPEADTLGARIVKAAHPMIQIQTQIERLANVNKPAKKRGRPFKKKLQ